MQFFRYEIPLYPSPLPLALRTGIIAQTEQGYGEIAPLPGFGGDPAFGLSSAQFPFPKAFPRIPYSGLASTYEEAAKTECQTLKLKVGSLSPREALALVTRIQENLPLKLRIDVNRKWSVSDAHHFLDALDLTNIEYVEEPLSDPRALTQFPRIPIALDETLLEEPIQDYPNIVALILKPTLLGDKMPSLLASKKKLVFSSSFESAIGLLHIAHLQARYSPEVAVGIDTFKYFKGNFFPIPTKEGFLLDEPLPPIDRKWLVRRGV